MFHEDDAKNALYYSYKEYREGGAAINPEEAYPDFEDTHVDWSLEDVFLKRPEHTPYNGCTHVLDVEDLEEVGDKPVYLVIVQYTTGDTFGTSYGNADVTAAFLDRDRAELLARRIADEGVTIGDEEISGWVFWTGYFERLERVYVEKRNIKYVYQP